MAVCVRARVCVYSLQRERRMMNVQVQACVRAEEKMRCARRKRIYMLDNLGVRANYIRPFFLLLLLLPLQFYGWMYVRTVLPSYSHLVPKMLTNAIIKWEGNLDEGRTCTSN